MIPVLLHRGLLLAAAARVARRTIPAARDPHDTSELCCVAARLLMIDLYGAETVDRAPVADWHLWSVARPWSPVDAAIACGVGARTTGGYIEVAAASAPGGSAPRDGVVPDRGVWLAQIWRGAAPGQGSGHTLVWVTDGDGDGWQLDGVEGRAYDLRVRSWSEIVAEARGGLRAVRLLAPERAP